MEEERKVVKLDDYSCVLTGQSLPCLYTIFLLSLNLCYFVDAQMGCGKERLDRSRVQKEQGSSPCISPCFALNNPFPCRAHSSFSRSPGFILFFTFRKISQYFPKEDFSKDPLSQDLL